ncbi:MAG: nucleotidyltransferase family protein [Patescibacteria group bacterium]|nr:nucleotidyltransferase family protein [Patescibacteria group bacterium]
MDKEEIKRRIKENLPILKSKYQVEKLALFGSVARGSQTQTSDIDILVELESPVGFFDFIRLEKFLSELLQRKVDLVTRNALKPLIRENILREAIYV